MTANDPYRDPLADVALEGFWLREVAVWVSGVVLRFAREQQEACLFLADDEPSRQLALVSQLLEVMRHGHLVESGELVAGTFSVTFNNGVTIRAEPHDQYEAWSYTRADGVVVDADLAGRST